MDGELRRRTPRVDTEQWPGKYSLDDDPWSIWRECCLLDISILGMGLELFGTTSEQLIGRRVLVHIDIAGGGSMSLHLSGVVRYLSPGQFGGTRAGIEFTGLSDGERSVLKVMEHLNAFW